MEDAMMALHANGTWELIPLPSRKSVASCHSFFSVKYLLDGTVELYKVRPVAKATIRPMVSTRPLLLLRLGMFILSPLLLILGSLYTRLT